MGFIDWTEGLAVGIPMIDAQHKTLIGLINRLEEARAAGAARDALSGIIGELLAYAATHFRDEEALFDAAGYPESRPHKAEHAAFTARMDGFSRDFGAGRASPDAELLGFLKSWLTRHIAFSDRKYRPYVKDAAR